MSTWKTKLFSNTRRNFYGNIVMGCVVCGAAAWYLIRAINLNADRTAIGLLLMAIVFVLLGIFGITWGDYCDRLAKKLEEEERMRREQQKT